MRRFVVWMIVMAFVAAACAVPQVTDAELADRLDEDFGSQDDGSQDDSASPQDGEDPDEDAEVPEAAPIIEFTGAIAIGGPGGVVIAAPDGEPLVEPDTPIGPGTQPTWSRDGERAAAFVPTVAGGSVLVITETETFVEPAQRPYFFFSWSGDGQYLAALGPGPLGTSLDILDPQGALVSTTSVDAGSLFLAWEPRGNNLVVHTDDDLALIADPTDLASITPLGSPGQWFTAPAWIPETRDVVIVDEADDGRLVRLNVDTLERNELGRVGYDAGFVVSPEGSRMVLTHSGPNVEFSDDLSVSYDPMSVPTQILGDTVTELISLDGNGRGIINYEHTLWAEWSLAGDALLMLQPGTDGPEWRLISEDGFAELGPAALSDTFAINYVPFAWQYVESPRLWSPNGDAFVYGGRDPLGPGVVVHSLATGPTRVSSGDVAFWAPELPASAPNPT